MLIQALLDAPMFITRWRWVAGVALALPRFRGGRKVPPQLVRMDAEDLISAIFPDQLACAENLSGEREIPDHPLVRQTIADCLDEAMDIDGFERLLAAIEAGSVRVVARELTEPSPLALEVLSARPYAFLDDAPLEERRTQAVMSRRWLDPDTASDLGRLDAEAIARVREEAWPAPANADELHDALVWLGFLTADEVTAQTGWADWLAALAGERRVTQLHADATRLWVSAERLPQFQAVFDHARIEPPIAAPATYAGQASEREAALVEIVRGRLEGAGPLTLAALVSALGLPATDVLIALAALESEGFALRGRFAPDAAEDQWCERRLLARIHRYTVKRLRAEIEPVAARDFLRFLAEWQRVAHGSRMEGPDAVAAVVAQLEGYEAPAGAWETELLPARMSDYEPAWLDDLCLAGRVAWARLAPRTGQRDSHGESHERRAVAPLRTTADHAAGAAQCARVDGTGCSAREHPAERPGAGGGAGDRRARRFVLRRAGRRHGSAAHAGRRGAGRAGRTGRGQLRQLRRSARAAGALGPAQALRRRAAQAAHGDIRHGGCRSLGAGAACCASLAPGRSTRRT